MKNRIFYIDLAKTIGIILVMLGHIYKNDDLIYRFIYSFHMPFFFILSGYFINYDKNKTIGSLIKNRLNSLIIPYAFFYILTYLYWVTIESKFRGAAGGISIEWWKPLIGLFYGDNENHFMEHNTPLWFIPTLLSVDLMNFLIYKIRSKKKTYATASLRCIAVVLLSLLGYLIIPKLHYLLPWGISHAMIALLFFFSGKYIRKIHEFVFSTKIIALVLMGFLYVKFMLEHIPYSDMFVMNFESPSLFVIYALYTSVFVLLLCDISSSIIQRIGYIDYVSFFGVNSLVVLCIHDPIKRIVIYVYSKLTWLSVSDVRTNIVYSLVCLVILMAILIPIVILYNRFGKPYLAKIMTSEKI